MAALRGRLGFGRGLLVVVVVVVVVMAYFCNLWQCELNLFGTQNLKFG